MELLLTIMSSIAQEESRSIFENVRWGVRKRMADGKVQIAFATFLGYDRGPNGELVVNEEQAVLVRRIFGMYLSGYTPTQIAQTITDEGIPTLTGKTRWHRDRIISILTNEKYKGDALLQKTYTADFLTKRAKINRGEMPQYYVKDDHEAIIEPDVFDHVQRMLAYAKKRKRTSSVSILAGKICCGDCGGYYGQKVWHSTDKYRRMIWRCNQKYEKGGTKCTSPHLTEEQVKKLFVKAVNALIARRESIISGYGGVIRTAFSTEKQEKRLEMLEAEIAELEARNEDLIERNATIVLDQDEYQAQRDNILEQYERLNAECQEITQDINEKCLRREQIERFRHEFEKLESLIEFNEMLWISMLEKMTVYSKDRIVFEFRDGSVIEVAL